MQIKSTTWKWHYRLNIIENKTIQDHSTKICSKLNTLRNKQQPNTKRLKTHPDTLGNQTQGHSRPKLDIQKLTYMKKFDSDHV